MELHQSGKAVPQMTESERLLRSILGPTRSDIRPLAFAIAVAEELLFNQGLAMDDVQITKQIYPMVARQFEKPTMPRQNALRDYRGSVGKPW